MQKICAIDCHQKEDKMSIEINLRPYKLAPLDYTVAVSRLQSFSAYSESRKTRPSYPPPPRRGHNRLRWHQSSARPVSSIPQHNIIYRDCVTGHNVSSLHSTKNGRPHSSAAYRLQQYNFNVILQKSASCSDKTESSSAVTESHIR